MSVHHLHSHHRDMFLMDDLYYPNQHAAPAAPVPSHHAPQQPQQAPPQQQQQQQHTAAPASADFMQGGDANARSSFPEKLHGLIMDAETMGFQDVVSWQDSGKSFKVHKPSIFQNDIIPKYFKPIKYTSFQRQLSIYGFQRIRTGWNTGGYEHPYFSRENSTMCKHIRRHQKPTAFTAPTKAPTPTPVISYSSASASAAHPTEAPMSPMTSIDDDLFKMYNEIDPVDAALAQMKKEEGTSTSSGASIDHHDFEPLPLGSTCLPRVSSHDNMHGSQHHHHPHGYHPSAHRHEHNSSHNDDHYMLQKLQSCFEDDIQYGGIIENPLKAQQMAAAQPQSSSSNNNNNNNKGAFFPAKLHQLLEDAERMNFRHIVSWTDNGRAFQIHDQKEFVSKIMSIYFDQSKFASFRRQLNLYGFNRTRTNNNKNMYFHENFIQGDPKQCEQMFRRCSGGASSKPSAPTVTSFAA